MNLIVFYNPGAGGGKWSARKVERLLRDAGYTVQMQSIKKKWRPMLDEEPDAFVAVGGDGTVHKVLRAVEDRGIPVAIMPTGTANNVAHSLGFNAGDDLAERVPHWRERERLLHMSRVEKRGKRRTFIEAIGFGVFAHMVSRAESGETRSSPDVAIDAVRKYLARELIKAKPLRIDVNVDGVQHSGEYLLLECLNLPYLGPRLQLAPDEEAASRTVTVSVIPEEARAEVARQLLARDGAIEGTVIGRGSDVTLTTDAGVHVDGDPWPRKNPRGGRLRVQAGVHSVRVWI